MFLNTKRKPGTKLTFYTTLSIAASLAACGGGGNDGRASNDAELPSTEALRATCSAMVGKTYAGATVTASKRYEANEALNTPAICQIFATKAPYLDLEVVVPDNWSGRFWQQGGSGFDGFIPSALSSDQTTGSLTRLNLTVAQRGAVYAASNGGNRGAVRAQAGPAAWFSGTNEGKQSAIDFAYSAVGTTLFFAKGVTQEFFKREAKHRYFNGCSNGGRNAYIAIERWPNEYDGVVSGCEGLDMAAQTTAWMKTARLIGTTAMPTSTQITAIYKAAVAKCDSNDGLSDGIIANYSACSFEPTTFQCGQPTASADPSICLTPAQLTTVQALVTDIKSSDGSTIYRASGVQNWQPEFISLLGSAFTALATNDGAWLTQGKIATFDPGRDYTTVAAGLKATGADHDKVAVAAFVAKGKKLINWHDSADELLSLQEHARNLASMHDLAKNMGSVDPSHSSRLFIVPGTNHGYGAPLTAVDWSDAIINWVESDRAPDQLTYLGRTAAGIAKSMPVCQYPQYPRYSGGNVNDATSYKCTVP